MDQKLKILIADDEHTGRQLLEAVLMKEDYQLIFVENGKQAFDITLKEKPDLVLLDVMMPEMDGFEACKKIRETKEISRIPIFLITALDDRDSRIKGLDVGANDYLSKPFDRIEILAKIKNTIQNRTLSKTKEVNTSNITDLLPEKNQVHKIIIDELVKLPELKNILPKTEIRTSDSSAKQTSSLFLAHPDKENTLLCMFGNRLPVAEAQSLNALIKVKLFQSVNDQFKNPSNLTNELQKLVVNLEDSGKISSKADFWCSACLINTNNGIAKAAGTNHTLLCKKETDAFQRFDLQNSEQHEILGIQVMFAFSDTIYKIIGPNILLSQLHKLHVGPTQLVKLDNLLSIVFKNINQPDNFLALKLVI